MNVINNKTENSYLLAAAAGHTCMMSTCQAVGLEAFKNLEAENEMIDRILQVR